MFKKKTLLVVTLSLLSSNSFAANQVTNYKREAETCLPMNNVSIEAGLKSFGTMSEAEYNQLLDSFQTTMSDLVKKRLNKKLIVEKKWPDATVDAFATRDDENNAVIVINGGLARHSKMSKDGLLLIACHELGHHLGGAPKIPRGNTNLKSWSSAEGQADYFATNKCLPLFFQTGIENKNLDNDIDANNHKLALSKCRDNVCARVVLAGLSVSQVFASLVSGIPEPSLVISDRTQVPKTIYNHPNPQCRLDTYLSGALCDVSADVPFDIADPSVGACMKDQGVRPACWFADKEFKK